MRKKWMYLFALVCLVGFFTACKDDDDKSGKEGWESLSGTYEGAQKLAVKLNEMTLPVGYKSVAVTTSSAEKASIVLNNLLPETPQLTLDVTLKETSGVYSFSGESAVADGSVTVEGSFQGEMLSVKMVRNVTSPAAGTWKLKYTTAGGSKSAAVYANIVTGNPTIDGAIKLMLPRLGTLIAEKVESVTPVLGTDGIFSVTWRKVGASEDSGLPENIATAISFQYCVIDGQLLLAIDKNYIELASVFLGDKLAEYGLKVEDLTKLLLDLGGYYAVPLEMKTEGNETTFYATKALIVPVMQVAAPILTPMLPENIQQLVPTLLNLLPGAQALDFGLVFTKE